jgi:hypothetical protein
MVMFRKALKAVSPVAALADDGIKGLKNIGIGGVLGQALEAARKDGREIGQNPRNVPVDMGGMAQPAGMAQAPNMMKKGGMVSKGIDGCAMKGKTRAKRSK